MDSSKCQTPAVSPAEPGDFSFLVKNIDQPEPDKRSESLAPNDDEKHD